MGANPPPLPGQVGLRPWRLVLVFVSVALMMGGATWLRLSGPNAMPYGCMLNQLTGLHCPGCGMTRASHAMLEGRVMDAMRFNPVGMVLLPILGVALGIEVLAWVRGTVPKRRIPIGKHGAVTLLVVVVAFGVLRNLPWWPFSLLAPH